MPVMTPAELLASERAGIADDFERFGADAPTLCEGWTAFDLIAHMVVREHEPLAASGIVLPGPFRSHLNRRMEAAKATGFDTLVARIRDGAGFPMRIFGPRANLNEYFIHREDLRRANGEGARELPDEYQDFLLSGLALSAFLAKARVRNFGLQLVAADDRMRTVRDAEPMVTLSGPPSEIVLYLTGRKAAAVVEIEGTEVAKTALAHARFAL